MQAYKLITGTQAGIKQFEQQIAQAMDDGYYLEGALVTQTSPQGDIHLFQAMLWCEDVEDDYEDEDCLEEEHALEEVN